MTTERSAFSPPLEARSRTLAKVTDLSQAQMDFTPGRGRWSVGEVLDHLIQVDRVFGEEIHELQRRWTERRGTVRLIRSLSQSGVSLPLVPDELLPFFDLPAAMAGVFFPRPVREAVFRSRAVPAKAPRRIEPRRGRPAAELLADLNRFSDDLKHLERDHPDVEWDRLKYYNPLTGYTDVPGILSFIASHEKRHQGQLDDLLSEPRFP